jgi:hypothetical protein
MLGGIPPELLILVASPELYEVMPLLITPSLPTGGGARM